MDSADLRQGLIIGFRSAEPDDIHRCGNSSGRHAKPFLEKTKMDYIRRIREKLGHQPIPLIGATVLVFDKQNRLLMQKRSENGKWGVPGGYMDLGEKIEDAARRETPEETGMKIGSLSWMDIYSGPELFYKYGNGDQVYIITSVYTAREYSVERNGFNEEVQEIGFFPWNNCRKTLALRVK
jgi:8-oxo-dGTP pyrophosphatase MutT (NUDIX family)